MPGVEAKHTRRLHGNGQVVKGKLMLTLTEMCFSETDFSFRNEKTAHIKELLCGLNGTIWWCFMDSIFTQNKYYQEG